MEYILSITFVINREYSEEFLKYREREILPFLKKEFITKSSWHKILENEPNHQNMNVFIVSDSIYELNKFNKEDIEGLSQKIKKTFKDNVFLFKTFMKSID